MKAQVPASNISKIAEFRHDKAYRIVCECTSTEHSVDTWIGVEHDTHIISVSFHVNTYNHPCQNIWERVKTAAKILFLGIDEKEHELVMNAQTAKNWISAVKKTINDFNESNENPNSK